MFEGTAILKKAVVTQDEALNEIETYTERTVFVRPRSVYASEFYQAAAVGLKPSLTTTTKSSSSTKGKSTQSRGSSAVLIETLSN